MTENLIFYLERSAEVAKVWGPLLIFILMAIESSVFPLPSEVVMIPAGFMAARFELFPGDPTLAIILAIFCGTVGSIAGAFANYFVSLKLGRPFLYRYGKWFFLRPHSLERAEAIFLEYGDVATFVGRLLPAIRHLISIPAGLSRMKLTRFSFFTGFGAGIWVTILTFIGYNFGRATKDMSYRDLVIQGKAVIHHNFVWILLGCAVVFFGYMWLHK